MDGEQEEEEEVEEEGEGGLSVRRVIFDTLMNSFKRFSKYWLMRAGRGDAI